MTWVTLDEARDQWADAADLEDVVLERYLDAAHEQCVAYAPVLVEGDPVPESWKVAQIMQARAVYRSAISGREDQIGGDGYTVTVFPMDWTVKNLLRPKRGRVLVR